MVLERRNVGLATIAALAGVFGVGCSDSRATGSGGSDGPRIVYHGDFAPSIPMSPNGHIASYTLHLGPDVKRYDAYLTLERRRRSVDGDDDVAHRTLCVASFETSGDDDPVGLSASYSSASLHKLKETLADAIEDEFGVPSEGIPLPEEVGPTHRLLSVKIQFQESRGAGHRSLERSASVVIKEPEEIGALFHGSPTEFSAPWPGSLSGDASEEPSKTRGIPIHVWMRNLGEPGSAMLVHRSLFGHRHAVQVPSVEELEQMEFEWRVILWLGPNCDADK